MNTDFYTKNSKLRIFMSFYKPHYKLFFLDLFCALLATMIDITFPLITRYALNTLLPGAMYSTFFIVMAGLVLAYILRTCLLYVVTYWGHTLGVYIEADMRGALFAHMQSLSFKFYDAHRTGHLISHATTDLFEITELAHHGPEDLFISLITLVGSLGILFSINWQVALLLLVLVPFTLLFTISRRRKMSAASKSVKERMAGINADVESSLSGARVAKAFANEEYEVQKLQAGNEKFKKAKSVFYSNMAIFHGGIDFFTNLFSVVVIALGGYLIMRGKMNVVDLLIFSMYVSTFLQPVRKLTQFVEQYATGMAGFNRFLEIMRLKPAIADKPDAVDIHAPKGEIEFRDVTFSYNDETQVLTHVNLTIKAGETLAVVGPSGGGKTTLCHLIPRFYDIDGGSICFDGMDIRDITLKSLRQSIGLVSQDVFLFAGTIRENIQYGRIGASEEEIIEAAKRAEIYDMIRDLSDGLDTYVGERGIRLSGGQKQRISIARIFLKNPPVLILDEATSALDTVTERKIQASFDELAKGRTTVVIAHRLSTVIRADEIIYIDESGIREHGTHEELLAQKGLYAKLYEIQFAEEI